MEIIIPFTPTWKILVITRKPTIGPKWTWWNNDLDSIREELRTLQSKWNRSTDPTDRLSLWKDYNNYE